MHASSTLSLDGKAFWGEKQRERERYRSLLSLSLSQYVELSSWAGEWIAVSKSSTRRVVGIVVVFAASPSIARLSAAAVAPFLIPRCFPRWLLRKEAKQSNESSKEMDLRCFALRPTTTIVARGKNHRIQFVPKEKLLPLVNIKHKWTFRRNGGRVETCNCRREFYYFFGHTVHRTVGLSVGRDRSEKSSLALSFFFPFIRYFFPPSIHPSIPYSCSQLDQVDVAAASSGQKQSAVERERDDIGTDRPTFVAK